MSLHNREVRFGANAKSETEFEILSSEVKWRADAVLSVLLVFYTNLRTLLSRFRFNATTLEVAKRVCYFGYFNNVLTCRNTSVIMIAVSFPVLVFC